MPAPSTRSDHKSTNVRAIRPSTRAFRGMTNLAARLAPGPTARWAGRRFLTPGRRPATAAGRAVLETGHRFSFRADGRELVAWSWGEGPTVFLMHGWGSRAARMMPFVAPLVAAGHSVVAFDGPGHGESAGTQSSVVELGRALAELAGRTALAEVTSGRAGLIAHSIGGVAGLLAARSGMRFGRMALLGSPSDLEGPSLAFAAASGLTPEVVERMQRDIEGRLGVPWKDLAVPLLVPDPPGALLVVHDRDDGEVPFVHAQQITRAWPGAELLSTIGLGHRRLLNDPEVIRRVVAFVAGEAPAPARSGIRVA
jgi:pimeloyl-ACP methyl ester carboxylesterase